MFDNITGLADAINRMPVPVSIADIDAEDNPLIYVNREFEKLTGYSFENAVGKNCRFLQGPETDSNDVRKMSDAISKRKALDIKITNYRFDGSKFTNLLLLDPLGLPDSKYYYIGCQYDLTSIFDQGPSTDPYLQITQSTSDEISRSFITRRRSVLSVVQAYMGTRGIQNSTLNRQSNIN